MDGLTVNAVAESAADGGPVPWQLRLLTDLGTSVWALALAVIAILLDLIVVLASAFRRGRQIQDDVEGLV